MVRIGVRDNSLVTFESHVLIFSNFLRSSERQFAFGKLTAFKKMDKQEIKVVKIKIKIKIKVKITPKEGGTFSPKNEALEKNIGERVDMVKIIKKDDTDKPGSTWRVSYIPKTGTEESFRGQRSRPWSARDRPPPLEEAGATRKRPQLKFLHRTDSNGSCALRAERGQGQRQHSAEQQLLQRIHGLMGYGQGRRKDRDIVPDGLVGYGRGRKDNRDTV
ncbi:uncharacterized protein LOC125723080 [Brienomyrus brachyistius]|uniref:uncharacterized protein LOC125723080 n=1 Tax=Brienomyrus brachyistius TaxID=42636 RepID=UPI0020B2F0EA|nr:uncharacterized protein LOC125723080 [Brienomyrus brachyistius]